MNDAYFYILIEQLGIMVTLTYIHKSCSPKGASIHSSTPGTPFFFEKDARYLCGYVEIKTHQIAVAYHSIHVPS
jgi:hypothetical protein